ncbi:MAG: DUF4169 family protein [Alphaproteobacteria bacterium]|nr:DUF4169 family protein [Alphaproteobacteria bacterium]MBV9693551.1 DUF4169 family protein [Alphaproteobacteria bacterium]
MAEIVNLRRVRKAKARDEKGRAAEANRIKHGVAKAERDLAKSAAEEVRRGVDAHKLENDKSK